MGIIGHSSRNNVIPLIDGAETFRSMVQAIRTATNPSHYIYFANWRMDLTFELIPGDQSTTIWNLVTDANKRNVELRAMVSKHVGHTITGWGISQVSNWRFNHYKLFSNLKNGFIIPDENFLWFGSHHQKLLIVKGEHGLIGFCGGIDFAENRLTGSTGGSGSGSGSGGGAGILGSQHDVHCRIEGPAAWELRRLFVERWEDHPDKPKGSTLRGKNEPIPPARGRMFVRIGRTYPNGTKYRSGIGKYQPGGLESARGSGYYSFAPNGA
ncbi:MAG: phospholipase D-like domain-containing protein, partial [Nitrososphaeraceae archaeon]